MMFLAKLCIQNIITACVPLFGIQGVLPICAQGTEEVLYIMFGSPCESKAVEQSTASLEIEDSETVRNKYASAYSLFCLNI